MPNYNIIHICLTSVSLCLSISSLVLMNFILWLSLPRSAFLDGMSFSGSNCPIDGVFTLYVKTVWASISADSSSQNSSFARLTSWIDSWRRKWSVGSCTAVYGRGDLSMLQESSNVWHVFLCMALRPTFLDFSLLNAALWLTVDFFYLRRAKSQDARSSLNYGVRLRFLTTFSVKV